MASSTDDSARGEGVPERMPARQAALVAALIGWVETTPWIDWLELGGSLGRGGGDDRSDVDVGIGVTEEEHLADVDAALAGLGPLVALLHEREDEHSVHVIAVYEDGLQVSLVVMPAARRRGLPPQASGLVDKSGALAETLDAERWVPSAERRREWAFLAWIGAGDALRHAARGHGWRAVRSLAESRRLYFALLAASRGVVYPQFGEVSLENAGETIPSEVEATIAVSGETGAIGGAVAALARLLEPFIAEAGLEGLARAVPLREGGDA